MRWDVKKSGDVWHVLGNGTCIKTFSTNAAAWRFIDKQERDDDGRQQEISEAFTRKHF